MDYILLFVAVVYVVRDDMFANLPAQIMLFAYFLIAGPGIGAATYGLFIESSSLIIGYFLFFVSFKLNFCLHFFVICFLFSMSSFLEYCSWWGTSFTTRSKEIMVVKVSLILALASYKFLFAFFRIRIFVNFWFFDDDFDHHLLSFEFLVLSNFLSNLRFFSRKGDVSSPPLIYAKNYFLLML